MLDIVLFREDQGGDPGKVRESQRRRYKDVGAVDAVIERDTKWRAGTWGGDAVGGQGREVREREQEGQGVVGHEERGEEGSPLTLPN